MAHCELLQTGEIQAIVGDASRDGVGGRQYSGLWSLTSRVCTRNAFVGSYAGLIPDEIRGHDPAFQTVDSTTASLLRKADDRRPADVLATYRLRAPYYVDHELVFQDAADVRAKGADFRQSSWCSYMNSPEDNRISFLSGGEWVRYVSPEHGVAASIAPSHVPEESLERWPEAGEGRPFDWDWAPHTFDEPFYYGRIGEMALLMVFDLPDWVRFFTSPTGGGPSLIPGKRSPAWDFKWVIPAEDYEVGRAYRFRMTLAYKKFVSDEDVLEEAKGIQRDRGFRRVER